MRYSHEVDRVESLRSYAVLGTAPEPEFDALTALASRTTACPVAVMSLVDSDTQWFKSVHGADTGAASVAEGLCARVVAGGHPVVVHDSHRDPRFDDLELRRHPSLRSFAGVPLVGRDGLPIGVLCVLDSRPRRFTPQQLEPLTRLAEQAMLVLELRRGEATRGVVRPDLRAELRDPCRLRQALEQGELVPWFQPVVDLATQRVQGLEALLRWEHPVLGTIVPGHFLPAVEVSSLMLPIGRRVLAESLSLLARLRAGCPGNEHVTVAVNVSYAQLARPGLAESVLTALEQTTVPSSRLMLEVTESTDLAHARVVQSELGSLREAGALVALDDYGTGYSSLERVLELPFTTLKLDRSITGRLPGDRRAAIVVEATVRMARGLEMTVVAEGVESLAQHEAVLGLGCDLGQGYLFGRAVPGEEVLVRLGGPHDTDDTEDTAEIDRTADSGGPAETPAEKWKRRPARRGIRADRRTSSVRQR